MLTHHGPMNTYAEAASAAAAIGRQKLLAQIERDRSSAETVIREMDEHVPVDSLVPLPKAEVIYEGGRPLFVTPNDSGLPLARWAQDQLAERVGMPAAFARELFEAGGHKAELAAYSLTRLAHLSSDRVLVRSVRGEVRGVLSDRFRRIDVRPSMVAFLEKAIALGALPLSGVMSETRAAIRVILPIVFEPVPGEVLSVGLELKNSDVGKSARELSLFIDRLWCTNLAIAHSELRTVHLGKRLTDEEFRWSAETMRLDSEAEVSAVRDVVENALSPERVNLLLEGVKNANDQKIDAGGVTAFLKKTLGTKAAVKEAEATFASAEVEMLPAGQTTWRLSNVLSLLAQSAPTSEQRLDYERAAGQALELAAA